MAETGATLGFDAIGGGPLIAAILSSMEKALSRKLTAYSRYGSPVHKQVYIYGALDLRPTETRREFVLRRRRDTQIVIRQHRMMRPCRSETRQMRTEP